MKAAFGYYLNLFTDNLSNENTDIFIIFNEANSKPTANELNEIQLLVESFIKDSVNMSKSSYENYLQILIEETNLKCVTYGVQVYVINISNNNKTSIEN